jgi:serine/threonine-protein kinase
MLEDLVGRGATGEVWRARHLPSGDEVAVKVLKAELAEDPELVARFLQERAVLLGLASPHLVRVRDLVVEGVTLAIVMDLVRGSDLRHVMHEGRVSPTVAIDITSQVLEGLAAVHRAGVIHRDVKPENILVDRTDRDAPNVRLTDFGVARLAHGVSITKVTGLIGTPVYMAPELSESGPLTPAIDLYSTGIVLYELLAGQPPFDAPHPMAVLRAHLESEPPPIDGLANALAVVLGSLLAKDPSGRPRSAEEARAQLLDARESVAGLAPLRVAGAADAAAFATTMPELGGTRVGSRRSNPGAATNPPGDGGAVPNESATAPLPVVAMEPTPTARRSRRRVIAGAVFAVVLLGVGVAVAAESGNGGPKLATRTTTRRPESAVSTTTAPSVTTTTAKKTVTKPAVTTTVPAVTPTVTAPPSGGGGSLPPVAHTPPAPPVTAPPLPQVPNVVGSYLTDASSRLNGAGFHNLPFVRGCFGAGHGRVVSQHPSGGSRASTSTPISLTVEATNCNIVPDVRGALLTDAASRLKSAGFNDLPFVRGCYGAPTVGEVVSESPVGGDVITTTAIHLKVQADNC